MKEIINNIAEGFIATLPLWCLLMFGLFVLWTIHMVSRKPVIGVIMGLTGLLFLMYIIGYEARQYDVLLSK